MTFRRFSRHLVPLVLMLVGAGLLAGCDNSGSNGPETMTYTADLGALNGSGVSGTATVTLDGERIDDA